jgi:hypothetical protein
MGAVIDTNLEEIVWQPSNNTIPNLETLAIVIYYVRHHGDDLDTMSLLDYVNSADSETDPKDFVRSPLRSPNMIEVTREKFDADLVDEVAEKGIKNLANLIIAANRLGIDPLVSLCAAKFAALVKGKEREEVKSILKPISLS